MSVIDAMAVIANIICEWGGRKKDRHVKNPDSCLPIQTCWYKNRIQAKCGCWCPGSSNARSSAMMVLIIHGKLMLVFHNKGIDVHVST